MVSVPEPYLTLHGEGWRLHGNNTGFSYYQGLPSAGMLPGAQGVMTAREHANHTSAYIANTSPFDCLLSLGNWFRLYSTASTYPQGQAHRKVVYQQWEVLQVVFREISLLTMSSVFFFMGFECLEEWEGVELASPFGLCSSKGRRSPTVRTFQTGTAEAKQVSIV